MHRSRFARAIPLFAAVLVLTVIPGAHGWAQELAIGTAGAGQGQTVYLAISLDDGSSGTDEVVAMQADVNFNPSVLTPGNASPGSGVVDHIVRSSVPSTGVQRLVIFSPSTSALADGEIATLALTIASSAPTGATPITLSNVVLATAGAFKLEPVDTFPGSIDVGGSGSAADLSVVKTVNNTVAHPGEPLTYTVTILNNGPENVSDGWFTDDIPLELTGVNWLCTASSGSSCTGFGSGDIHDQISIEVGDTLTYTIIGTLASTLSEDVINTAWISAPAPMIDPVGTNNSDTATSWLDAAAPQVTWVGSISDTGDGSITDDEHTGASLSQMMVQFDEEVLDPTGDSDPHDATNPANYRLIEAGPDAILQTTVCGPAQGDDVLVDVPMASHWAPTRTTYIFLNGAESLPEGQYRFLVCGSTSIKDVAFNSLDGDGDGIGGDDFARDFVITATNLLLNPNLDDDLQLGGWTISSPQPGEISFNEIDVDGYSTSGSAEVQNFTGPDEVFELSQCVPVFDPDFYRVGGLVDVTGGVGDDPQISAQVRLFSTTDCSGSEVANAGTPRVFGDTGGTWLEVGTHLSVTPGVHSAQIQYLTEANSASSFSVLLDRLFFGRSPMIFADGFENGFTDAWSTAVGTGGS